MSRGLRSWVWTARGAWRWRGRAGRSELSWWLGALAAGWAAVMLTGSVLAWLPASAGEPGPAVLAWLAVGLALMAAVAWVLVASAALLVRRWHDMGRRAWLPGAMCAAWLATPGAALAWARVQAGSGPGEVGVLAVLLSAVPFAAVLLAALAWALAWRRPADGPTRWDGRYGPLP